MTDNKIHSWKSELTNDKQEENRIGNNMKCYKYELLFNSPDEMDIKKIQFALDTEFMERIGCSYSELRLNMNNKKTDILELLHDLRDNCFHEYIDEHELLDKIEEIRELILILRVRDGYIV